MTAMFRSAPVLAGLLLVAGCTASGGSDDHGAFLDPAVPAGSLRLVSFDSCDQAAGQLRATAREHVGPWGFGVEADMAADGAAESRNAAPEAPAAPAPALKAPSAAEAPEHSDTNVHEAGVDEPDLVKTDGRRIVVVGGGMLRVVDAERRVQLGSLNLGPGGYAADLLLAGDRALVLLAESLPARSTDVVPPGAVPPDVTPEGPVGPRVLLVDLNGPGVISEYIVDGWLVDARAVGTTARVVVRSSPRIAFPEYGPDAGEKTRLEGNRKAVAGADLADWLPRYEVTTGGETSTGQVDCTAMSRPASYSGTSMLTVLTFDLTAPGLGDGAPVSVVADGDTVYGSGPSLYVATDQRWRPDPADGADPGTEIYKFDTSQAGPPTFVASGRVDGWLINQYAMSEWDGHLRVATTSGEAFFGEQTDSESAVYVLAERGGKLVVTGSVGGLGKGERIHSVRFTGPVGYVVTFRQTDPLYTVDLRDPDVPVVLGELKITGYSAYLHPTNDGRLIGVGQEADLQGVTQGTQVSLFDVSDLSDPTLQAKHLVPYGSSEAEFDAHAFLWWPAERLLVLPLYDYQSGSAEALLLRVEETGFTELGRISHPGQAGVSSIRRSLVIEDALWTISDSGLAAHSLSTFDQIGWVSF